MGGWVKKMELHGYQLLDAKLLQKTRPRPFLHAKLNITSNAI